MTLDELNNMMIAANITAPVERHNLHRLFQLSSKEWRKKQKDNVSYKSYLSKLKARIRANERGIEQYRDTHPDWTAEWAEELKVYRALLKYVEAETDDMADSSSDCEAGSFSAPGTRFQSQNVYGHFNK